MKKWYKSKTLWVGILQVVAGVAVALSEKVATGSAITVSGVLMIILRVITKEPIK